MITVKTPDGGVATFPDGTPKEVIQDALRKKFGAPGPAPTTGPDAVKAWQERKAAEMGAKRPTAGTPPARQAEIDAKTEFAMNDPGAMRSALAGATQGATFGFGDEMAAGLASLSPNVTYDDALARARGELENARAARPGLTIGAEVAGALAVPVGGLATTGSLPLRMGKSAAATGALSGIYGFGAGEGGAENRAIGALPQAAAGGSIGALIPGVGAAIQSVLNSRAGNRAIQNAAKNAPSTDELRALGRSLYDQVDSAGVQIAPQAFDRARGDILTALQNRTGFDQLPGPGSLTPNTARTVQIMDEASNAMASDPTAALPFKALDQMRRQAGAAAGNVANKTDQQAGMTVIEGLDDFVGSLGPGDVVAGDVQALQTALPKAREIWQRMSKSQTIDDAIEAGGDYLSGMSSGIRNQFKNILRNPKKARQFSDAEIAAMRKVVQGSIPEQLLQLAGGGLGQMATAIGGGAMGGVPGFLLGAGAAAATRKAAEAVTSKKAEIVRALIANGGMQTLPVASPRAAQVTETLLRRGTAAASQPR